MQQEQDMKDTVERLGIVVIIPTYNNHLTLRRVIDGILLYNVPVIVVDDGSTDTTAAILASYGKRLTVISFPVNQGKGMALRAGFAAAKSKGFDYAITIDSDGQHYPSDLVVFIEELARAQAPLLLIGSRNMSDDSVPKKSSFGNKFSNFWFWFETGIQLTDTQSGFRAYPLKYIPRIFYTKKFEFEIEVIVRTAWAGIKVRNVPIQVLYDPQERVSHFRPFKDFTRISLLNTVLVFLTFFYILPRNFFKNFKKKSLDQFVKENVFCTNDSPAKKAASIGLGVFMGIAPVWGFQTAIVMTLAVFLRLNKILAFVFSNISLPPMIPLIIYCSLLVGGMIVPTTATYNFLSWQSFSFEAVQAHIFQYVVGSLTLAISMALLVGFGSYVIFRSKYNKTIPAE